MSGYSDDWETIAWGAKEAAGFRCLRCSEAFEGDDLKFIGVHHKDYNKLNNDPSNLEVLCWPCHQAIHLKNDPLFYEGEEPESYWRLGLPKPVRIKEIINDVLARVVRIQRINLKGVKP